MWQLWGKACTNPHWPNEVGYDKGRALCRGGSSIAVLDFQRWPLNRRRNHRCRRVVTQKLLVTSEFVPYKTSSVCRALIRYKYLVAWLRNYKAYNLVYLCSWFQAMAIEQEEKSSLQTGQKLPVTSEFVPYKTSSVCRALIRYKYF